MQAKSVLLAFDAERTYLLVTTRAKKPEGQPTELMTDLHRHISAVDELRENNRASPLFQHLSAIAEGIVALSWIVEKRPSDFVSEALGAAQYYGNKVLKEYKEKLASAPWIFWLGSKLTLVQGRDTYEVHQRVLQDIPCTYGLHQGAFCTGTDLEQ